MARKRLNPLRRAKLAAIAARAAREGERVYMRSAWECEGIPAGKPSLKWEHNPNTARSIFMKDAIARGYRKAPNA